MNEKNPLNAARKNQSGRRKKKLRDIVTLGKGTEVVVRPTTKSSEEAMGEGRIKEDTNMFKLLRRRRRRKASDGKLIRKNMKASGSFPPLPSVAMSEKVEALSAWHATRGLGQLASALWVGRKRYANFGTMPTSHEVTSNSVSKCADVKVDT